MSEVISGKSISKFLKRYHQPNTIKAYRKSLIMFFNYIYDLPETRIVDGTRASPDMEFYDRKSLEYLAVPRDHSEDLAEFIASLGTTSPSNKRGCKSTVILWLAANKIFLHPQETRGIKTVGGTRTRDRIPTQAILRQILDHCDLHLRMYLILLSSTGMRPGEAISLHWSDIDEKRGRIYLRPECTKTGESRICYMSLEAMELLTKWKEYHPRYLKRRNSHAQTPLDNPLERVFPAAYNTTLDKYNLVLEKAGLDERDPSTRRSVIHLHSMRKFFRTRLPMGGATVDVTETLMGHEGYLAGSYVRLTEADLETAYRAAEHELWVYRTKPINEAELKDLKKENADLRRDLVRMSARLDLIEEVRGIRRTD